MPPLLQDLHFAFRQLRKAPGFTAVAVLTLVLGIGANTAIFSLIDALMLKSLPVHDPQELVLLKWSAHKKPEFHSSSSYGDCNSMFTDVNPSGCSFSRPFYDDLRGHSSMLSGVTAFGGGIELIMAWSAEREGAVLASFLHFMRRSREGIRKSLKAYPRIRPKEPQS